MKKVLALICGFVLLFPIGFTQIVNREALSPRITGYKIDAELDPDAKTISGSMNAYWINISEDDVPDIRLHMYLNAFRSNKSTFYKESGGSPGSTEKDCGWIEIKSMTDQDGNDLTGSMKYISPDDGNPDDMTVLKVDLPEPIKPGDTVRIDVTFKSKLPSKIRRTGYVDDFFFVAQWFPKFGVYEPAGMRYAVDGGWNCHQFHNTSEFYANHSTYDVSITVPDNYVVGSGGMVLNEEETGGNRKTILTRAEDIVDFAWTAWPSYAVANDQWENVKIRFLYPPERKDQVERQLTAVKNALEYLSENVGPYPWPYLTFVDPPAKGNGAGGMEYTTIFTSLSFTGMPEYTHIPEMVTIHEFGHAYFMGILASNEFEEPWLDEGVNSFWEQRMVDHYYGPAGGMLDNPLLKISDESTGRMAYVTSGSRQAVSNAAWSWNYPHYTYSMMSYQKTATWLYTLMGIIGEEATNEIFREYYREWGFKNPSGKDFINVVNKVVHDNYGDKFGPDMNWFFNQVTYGTGICDYKVNAFYNRRNTDYEGVVIDGDSVITKENLLINDTIYTATVELERLGDIVLPVDVLIHFDNGDQVLESWDGKSRVKDYEYTGTGKVDWVKIDPEYKITMDVNYINNSMTSKPNPNPVKRMKGKMVVLLQFLISFITL
jgi:hypothetical protein